MKQFLFTISILSVILLLGCQTTDTASVKLDRGEYAEAIPMFKADLAKNPDNTKSRTRLGFAYLKTGRLDEAISELTRVLGSNPGEPFSILYLGQAYLNKQAFDEALSTWNTPRAEQISDVEKEIKRQKTHLLISQNQHLAKRALLDEEKLQAIETDGSTIAVFDFHPLSDDRQFKAIQKGLGAMLTTDLSKIRALKVIERMQLQALLKEMALGQTGIIDYRTAPRLGRLLQAETLVVGNLSGNIDVSASVVSSSKETIKGSSAVSVDMMDFYRLPPLIVRDLTKILGVVLSPEEEQQIGIPHTKNYKAFIFYGEALDALDAGEFRKARDLFASALKEDPNFGLARSGFDLVADFAEDGEVIIAPTMILNKMLQGGGPMQMGMGADDD